MIKILDHTVLSSVKEFLTYKLAHQLQAFSNKTVSLFPYTGARRFVGKTTYGSSYAQWLYDSSISGAQIPSGVNPIYRGTSGMSIDFKNGRVIVNSGVSITGSINVSVPDFNIYVTTTPIQRILLENKMLYAPELKAANQQVQPDSIIAPCIFISYTNTTNEEHAIGGVDETIFSIQIAVFADNLNQLFGVQKVVRDMSRSVIPLLAFTPFNELNDLKYGYWYYKMLLDYLDSPEYLLYINNTSFKILDLDYVNEKHPNMLVGLGNISVSRYRDSDILDDTDFPTIYQQNDSINFYSFDEDSLSESNP